MSDFIIENNKLKDYKGNEEHVVIPAGVTLIGWQAFKWCKSLKSITIPDTVTAIDSNAFEGCTSLMSIMIPNRVTTIGSCAFKCCTSLTSIMIPDSVTTIGSFENCTSLTNITIPASVTEIGYRAFENCTSLTSITIPASVIEIESYAFKNCTSLTSITIPESVTTIGDMAFENCTSLTSITIPAGVTKIGTCAFENCTSLTSITIPASVTEIGYRAFENCTSLTNITIPEENINIGAFAFRDCKKTVNSDGFLIVSGKLFRYDGHEKEVTLPDNVRCIDADVFKNNKELTSIIIPDGSTEIGSCAFCGCENLVEINIPKTVTSIGRGAFWGCESLTSIEIPDGVTEINEQTFCGCRKLTHVTFPATLNEIGDKAFNGCEMLTLSLTGITHIGREAFDRCKYASVSISNDIRYIDQLSFRNISGLREVIIPEGVTEIAAEAFFECRDLTHVTIPETMKKISAAAFKGCNLQKVTISALVLKNTEKAFAKHNNVRFTGIPAKDISLLPEWCKSHVEIDENENLIMAMTGINIDTKETLSEKEEAKLTGYLFTEWHKLHNKPEYNRAIALLTAQSRALLSLWTEEMPEYNIPPIVEQSIQSGIRYADSESAICPPEVVRYIVAGYAHLFDDASSSNTGNYGTTTVLEHGGKLSLINSSDAFAKLLDRQELIGSVRLAAMDSKKYRQFVLAAARYADEMFVERMISSISENKRGKAGQRYQATTTENALLLNETLSAIRYLDKCGKLDSYSKIHNVSVDECRDRILEDMGFASDGTKTYDLGSRMVVLKIADDLSFAFTDTENGKVSKTLPKKNADPEKYNIAKTDAAALKKNVNEIMKQYRIRLLGYFLDDIKINAQHWRRVYLEHPVLRNLGRLLVWVQDDKTFTIREGLTVLNDGTQYTLSDEPIRLAHPMEMQSEDVLAWQKYFIMNQLRQPFVQIWEPVCQDLSKVQKNRYAGIQIPLSMFKNQKLYGIKIDYDMEFNGRQNTFYSSGFSIKIDGIYCHGKECESSSNGYDAYEITEFGRFIYDTEFGHFEYEKITNRRFNHYIVYLDGCVIQSLILKEDSRILDMLPEFTAAQIIEFIAFAAKNNCTGVSAMLMEYKQQHFPDVDPLAEFVLEF